MRSRDSRRVSVVCLVVAMGVAGQAYAWSGGGHKTVAFLACEELGAKRTDLIAILKEHPQWQELMEDMPDDLSPADEELWLCAQAAVWPDNVRADKRFHRDKWHYINTPLFLDEGSEKALKNQLKVNLKEVWSPAVSEDQQNAPQTVDRARRMLSGTLKGTPRQKALMLSWLIHVVGDLHQPLHTVAVFSKGRFPKGDFGGGGIIILPGSSTRKPTSLHSFWDAPLGKEVDLAEVKRIVADIRGKPQLIAKAKSSATELAVKTWIGEGTALAKSAVYTPAISKAITQADPKAKGASVELTLTKAEVAAYRATARALAQERVAIGGFRLAELLKSVLK